MEVACANWSYLQRRYCYECFFSDVVSERVLVVMLEYSLKNCVVSGSETEVSDSQINNKLDDELWKSCEGLSRGSEKSNKACQLSPTARVGSKLTVHAKAG